VGLPAGGDGLGEEAGQLVLESGDGDEVAWGKAENAAEGGGLALVAGPQAGLFHVVVRVEGQARGTCDVLDGKSAGEAVLAQGTGVTHELTGGAPQGAGQGGEFVGGGQCRAAFPRRDVVGRDVGHAVGGAHAVGDVAVGHPEFLAQSAGGARVEGEGWMHGARVGSYSPLLHGHCRLHPVMRDRSSGIS
jgi:hypothetical protein